MYKDKCFAVLDYPVTIQVKMISSSSISSNKLGFALKQFSKDPLWM